MLKDNLKVVGAVSIVVKDKNEKVVEERKINNLVVTSGKNFIASALQAPPVLMSHMALGSGTIAPAAAQTALETEIGRVALTDTTVVDNVVTYTATFPPGTATGAVTEAGIFNSDTAGTMLCRTSFPVVNKGADDTISITWEVSIL